MFSVAYSSGESSGTSQSFLGNKDSKTRYNHSSKEMPETQVELSSGSNRNFYSQVLLCQGFASVQTKLTNYGYALPVSLLVSVT